VLRAHSLKESARDSLGVFAAGRNSLGLPGGLSDSGER
jgi:hypothetical protein